MARAPRQLLLCLLVNERKKRLLTKKGRHTQHKHPPTRSQPWKQKRKRSAAHVRTARRREILAAWKEQQAALKMKKRGRVPTIPVIGTTCEEIGDLRERKRRSATRSSSRDASSAAAAEEGSRPHCCRRRLLPPAATAATAESEEGGGRHGGSWISSRD